jgi:hypothetical protein
LRYVLIGKPENVTPAGLARIREAVRELRDPRTSARRAAVLARETPAIVWIYANVHGDETSGTDAELRVLYELADREDCAAHRILDHVLVGIIPTQNPDGREAHTRQNAYGFDLNRDWFARTQRETDAKLELLRHYPGVLYIDAHEMTGNHYFFPPAADPTYHEVTSEAVAWTDNIYGAALAAEFDRQHIQHWSDRAFDFFAMVYGDTVPSVGFGGAGMTFEKAALDPISQRTYEHYVTHWVSLSQAAFHKERLLLEWHGSWVEAYRQGIAGQLEPNEVNDRGHEVTRAVPEEPVRHYFLRADDAHKTREVQALVRRLQRMDVEVYRLTAPLAVPDFWPYGGRPSPIVLPAGTYWIPLAQMQKHWVQALLNEDTYVPFPYFYDVSGWSNPLLFNVEGGRSGARLVPSATREPLLAEPSWPALPPELPTVAVYQVSEGTSALESTGWLRYLLEQVWHLPYRRVSASEIAAGALAGVDILLVPNGVATAASNDLGPTGRQALIHWVNAGGRYIGWRRGGVGLAARLGLSTARLEEPNGDISGSLIRVHIDESSPLGAGAGSSAWVFYEYDLVMQASAPAHAVARYPSAESGDFFVSGYAEGEEELAGTAAILDEPVGAGRVILFASDPNYRAWTEGTQRLLRNAILGPAPSVGSALPAGSTARSAAEGAARSAAQALPDLESPLRLSVRPSSATRAESLLKRHGATYRVRRLPDKVTFLVDNPGGLTGDKHPFAAALARDLLAAGLEVLAYKVP